MLAGGDANLAFREDEELRPYKKKSRPSLFCGSLDDDDSFTIPAWTQDSRYRSASRADSCQSILDKMSTDDDDCIYATPSSSPARSEDVSIGCTPSPCKSATRIPVDADTASQRSAR